MTVRVDQGVNVISLKLLQILLLDETTSATDTETDSLVQQTIRKAFKDCTLLTIAHRLNTIMVSDRIMVLEQGKVRVFYMYLRFEIFWGHGWFDSI